MERKAVFFQMKVRLKSEVRISWRKNGMVNNGKRILLPMEEILHHLGYIRLISRRNISFLCIIERKESAWLSGIQSKEFTDFWIFFGWLLHIATSGRP